MNEPRPVSYSYPRRALRASVFLIAIECLMLAYPSRNWEVTGGLFLCAVSRLWTIRRGWCLTVPLLWNALFLVVLFAAKFSFAPEVFPTDAPFVNTELAHEIGCWLVAMQILLLHERASLKRIPAAFAALGCLVILCAGDIRMHSISRHFLLVLMILFVGGLGWFSHAGRSWIKLDQRRRLRQGILLATLVLAGIPTVYAARAWHQHERDLELLLLKIMQAFDGNSREHRTRSRSALVQVSNGKIFEPELPVLRVIQDSSDPLYLRGSVLNSYRNSTWMARATAVEIEPRTRPLILGLPSNESLFQLAPSDSQNWTKATVNYLSKEDPVPLAPLQTAEIQIAVSQLRVDTLGNMNLLDESLPNALTDFMPVESRIDDAPAPTDHSRLLPADLDSRVLTIAENIFEGITSDTKKIRAVEDFFQTHFRYQLGLEIPRSEDPITHFLINKSPAHCEYFASGAAVLLRAGGVPTRYVTGYVPSERHANGVWIARRKDAHAWVEAYDSGLQRWVTVEASPSAALPERRDATWKNSFTEAWRIWHAEFRERFALFGIWSATTLILQSNVVRVALGGIMVALWWGVRRRQLSKRTALETRSPSRVFPFQLWLRKLESDLALRGFERLPQETLLHFRDRILASPRGKQLRTAAEWYSEYSMVRYNESEQTDARVAQLELAWQNLAVERNRP